MSNARIIDTLNVDRDKGFRIVDVDESIPDEIYNFTDDRIGEGDAVGMVDWATNRVTLARDISEPALMQIVMYVSHVRRKGPPTEPTYFFPKGGDDEQ